MFNTINYLSGRRVSSVAPPRKKSSKSSVNTKMSCSSTNELDEGSTRTTEDFSDHSSSSHHSDDINNDDNILRLEAYPSRSFRRKINKERAVALMGHVKQQKQIRKMFQGETTTAMMKLRSSKNNAI